MKLAAVYIMADRNGGSRLYIDVTADLPKRLWAHKNALPDHLIESLPDHNLVYYEITKDLYTAMLRHREIQHGPVGSRGKLIKTLNPQWQDLSERVQALAEKLEKLGSKLGSDQDGS